MTIDERLEALTQSVELLAGMQIKHEERMGKLERLMEEVLVSMARLAHIADIHERRITDLEGNDLEGRR